MQGEKRIWLEWAQLLHHWGMGNGLALFLESAGVLTILGAQFLFFIHPWISNSSLAGNYGLLAQTLEDPARTKIFIEILKETGKG